MRGAGQARPTAAGAAVVVLVAALGLIALTARSGRTETVRPLVTAAPTRTPEPGTASPRVLPTDPSPAANTPPDPPLEVGVLVFLVLVAVLVGLALFGWIVVQRIRMRTGIMARQRVPAGPPAPPTEEEPAGPAVLAAAIEAGLRELEEGPPGDGVIACWVQLERAAAEAGAGRAAPETPSELAGRLIDTRGVESGPLVRLAELYREARFSTHPVGEAARTEARSLLEQVRADLLLASVSMTAPRPARVRR